MRVSGKLRVSTAVFPRKDPPLPIEYEDCCVPELIWALRRRFFATIRAFFTYCAGKFAVLFEFIAGFSLCKVFRNFVVTNKRLK